MSIRFILGRAGSGKTTSCLLEMARLSQREPLGDPLIFLVPEQATFEMEKELAFHCNGGTFRAQILSFRRMAYHLLAARGNRLPAITDLGRRLVLRHLLHKNSHSLTTLERAARQPRFCEQLAATLREFKNYQIVPNTLTQAASATRDQDALRGKLSDLAVIYEDYLAFTKSKFMDPEDLLTELAACIREGELPAGTRVWVDGFAGFTPQEYSVLGALIESTAQVDIALCLDPSMMAKPSEDDLFQPTLDTYLRLQEMIREKNIQVIPPLILPLKGQPVRFDKADMLAHLEANFDTLPAKAYVRETNDVKLVTTAGVRAEVEAAARDIIHLTREKGWRFRDIAVILRNFSSYHDTTAAIFTDYGIPYYVDERRSAAHHPLVEFLRSALEAVLSNFRQEPVIQMLKTDLMPLTREEADKVENYVRIHGIRGNRWIDETPWNYHLHLTLNDVKEPDIGEPEDLNEAKLIVKNILAPFAAAVGGSSKTASEYCLSVWKLLESVDADKKLQAWSDEAEKNDQMPQSQEHKQVWDGVIELLEQMDVILGNHQLVLQDFTEIFLSGLESLKLGLIPATNDRVIIGNVERSRQPQIHASYILGMNEGVFPARLQEEGVFADNERISLQEYGVELAVTSRQKLLQEKYLSYIALTRSSQYLWVSCPLADEEGKAKRPSPLFNRLREIFPSNKVLFYGNTPDTEEDFHALAHPDHIAASLLLMAGDALRGGLFSPFWAAVYQKALQHSEIFTQMQAIWPALSYRNTFPPLTQKSVDALFGTTLKSSVSRLESFARCPFAHFAQYGLRLNERRDYSIEAPEMGTFFHAALRSFVEYLQKENTDWSELTVDEAREIMNLVVSELLPYLNREILLSSARFRYLAKRLRETLSQAVTSLTVHAQQSKFTPVAVELAFGRQSLPGWQLQGENVDLVLTGQVDRVDTAKGEERTYLRVIDYKSSPTSLKLSDLWHGLSLQLLAYLAVINEYKSYVNAKDAECAGALYFGIYRPYERVDNPKVKPPDEQPVKLDGLIVADKEIYELMGKELLIHASLKKDGTFHKRSRVVERVQMEQLMAYLQRKVLQLAGRIKAGVVEAAPYKKPDGRRACTYCPYSPLCCFDVSMPSNQYRLLNNLSTEEVLDAVTRKETKNGQ